MQAARLLESFDRSVSYVSCASCHIGVQARHCDGHDYMPEKRRALEVLRTELDRVADGEQGGLA